jgi:hypothetical protein
VSKQSKRGARAKSPPKQNKTKQNTVAGKQHSFPLVSWAVVVGKTNYYDVRDHGRSL